MSKNNENNKKTERDLLRKKILQSTWVRGVIAAAGVVVFCTVYALILPAAATTSGNDAEDYATMGEADGFYPETAEAAVEETSPDEADAQEGTPEQESVPAEGAEAVAETAAPEEADPAPAEETVAEATAAPETESVETAAAAAPVETAATEGTQEASTEVQVPAEVPASDVSANTAEVPVTEIKTAIPEGEEVTVVSEVVNYTDLDEDTRASFDNSADSTANLAAADSVSGNNAAPAVVAQTAAPAEEAPAPAEASVSDNMATAETSDVSGNTETVPAEADATAEEAQAVTAETEEIVEEAVVEIPVVYAHDLSGDANGVHFALHAEDSAMLPETTRMIVEEAPVDQYDLSSLGDLVYGRVFTVRFTAEMEAEDGSLIISDVIPADNVQMTVSTDAPALGELDTKVALDLDRNGAYALQESADSEFVFTAGQISTVGLFVVDGEPEVEEIPVFAHELTAEVSGMTVKVEAADAAMIPEKAQLVVEEVASDAYANILSSLTNVKASHFLKFSIKNEITAEDGTVTTEAIIPASALKVTVTVLDEIKSGYKKIALNPADGNEYVLGESDAQTYTFETTALDTVGLVIKSELAEKLTVSVDGGEVVVEAGEDAGIPENAVLLAEEIPVGSVEYNAFRNDAASKGKVGFARFFRLSLKDADGTDIIPATPVTVSFDLGQNSNADAGFRAVLDMDNQSRRLSKREAETFTYEAASFGTVGAVAYDFLKLLHEVENDYSVTMYYNRNSGVPDGATLSVRELDPESDEYKEYRAMLEDALDSETGVKSERLFDITLLNDGQEIEPTGYVNVEINLADKATVEGEEIKVVHFEETAASETTGSASIEDNGAVVKTPVEIKEVETTEKENESVEVKFEADKFSIYGIVGTKSFTVPFVTGDGRTYEVTVSFGKEAGIPEGAQLSVTEVGEDSSRYEGYVSQAAEAIDVRTIDLQYVKLLDISIVDTVGNKISLNAPVDVQIKLLDQEQVEKTTQVVHFEGTDETPVVMESGVDGDAVSFATDGFSVYAVVDSGDTGEYARMTIEFYDHDGTLLETAYVKNDDTLAEIVEIVSDPNPNVPSGKLFKGWIDKQDYTVDDADRAKTLGQIREWAESKTITENETVKFYPVIYTSFRVTYKDGDDIIVGTENKLYPYSTTSIPYTVNMAYTAPDDEHNFEGWLAVDGMSNITSASYVNDEGQTVTIDTTDENAIYPNGASLTITGNVTFGVSAPAGHWLVFHENGKNATYNAPQFIKQLEKTKDPGDPERYGYTFGGWYTDEACTDGHEFEFGSTISQTTHVYAKWTANATAPYTIIIWKQNVDGTGYDFEETVTGTGNVGNNIPLGNTTSRSFEGFHLKETPADVKITPEGNAVINVYYDRTQYTLTFQQYSGGWGGSWVTVKTITALYGQNISSNFPIVGSNGRTYDQGERWDPQSSTPYSEVLVYIDVMPAANVTFHLDEANRPLKTMNWYVEALPNDTGTVSAPNTLYEVTNNNVVSANGKRFVLYKSISARYNGVTPDEDFINLDGFTKIGADSRWTTRSGTKFYIYDERNDGTVNFYYSRDSYKILYLDGIYVDGNNNPIDEEKAASWGTSADIHYQDDISSYNKGGNNYFIPTKENYVFDGWYTDSSCTTPYTFDKMPKGGIKVYAKWRQVQYRVFLHPNVPETDTTLSWGDEDLPEDQKQQMNFRISLGDTVSVPTGLRSEYEMVGWYLDEACTQLFNADNYVLNETTVTQSYDKATHMTDPMNKYGNITDTSAAFNSDARNNRNWITKEFNLYAKWRKVIDGAEGIGVVYNAGEGSGTPPTDNNLYLDSASATALTSGQIVPPTPPAGSDISEYVFDYWVLQTWDEQQQKYVDTSTYIYPGDTFVVLIDNAKKEPKLDDQGNQIFVDGVAQYNYTVQLRAEYVPKDIATPTHIDWFANNGSGASVSDSKNGKLKINEPVAIRPANTFTYAGHKFLGWARIEDSETGTHPDRELTEADLWLIYDEATNTFKVKQDGTTELRTVSQIAADERNPYHDLYAVWEKLTYTVSIQKTVVDGTSEDENTAFKINYDYDNTSLTDGSVERKHGQEAIVISTEVPYGTIVTVSETGYTAFEKSYSASRTTDDQGTEITPEDVAPETTGGGNFKITGDTIITVTNTRKAKDVIFIKTLEDSQIGGDSSPVTAAEFTLTDGTNTYTAKPANDGTVTFTDVLFGEYTLSETAVPIGYAAIAEHTVVVDANGYSIQLNGEDIGVDGGYTINDPKAETGSITLVKTNENGSQQLDGATFEISTYDTETQKYLNPVKYEGVGNKEIPRLKLGTRYQLQEKKAPDGYILLGDLFYFQIKLDGTVQITDENGTVITDYTGMKISLNDRTISVKNEPGQALPRTGGAGTKPFTLSGLALIIASALLYGFRMRRRERRCY